MKSWEYIEFGESLQSRYLHVIRVAALPSDLHASPLHSYVNFTWKIRRSVFDWLQTNMPDRGWYYDILEPTEFCFTTKQQAMLFKLTFSSQA